MDSNQNISSIRHFLKKHHWVSDVFAGMCLTVAVTNNCRNVVVSTRPNHIKNMTKRAEFAFVAGDMQCPNPVNLLAEVTTEHRIA